jgi:hypothetical protein
MIDELQRFFDEEYPRLRPELQQRVLNLARLYIAVHDIERTDPERGKQLAKLFGVGGAS